MPRIVSQAPLPESGLSATDASAIFEQINRFAGYGFNKSHAAAYAAIGFQTAYLKTHHPESFFAAAMNLDLDVVEDIAQFADELKSRDIPLWAPSINQSASLFRPIELSRPYKGHAFGISYGLCAIRGVGRAVGQAIEDERRANGPFSGFDNVTERLGSQVNKTALRALAKAGAFDALGLSRSEALARAGSRQAAAAPAQMSMFGDFGETAAITFDELDRATVLDNELDVLGHYMSAHPLDGLRGDWQFRNGVIAGPATRRRATMAAIVTKVDMRRSNSGDTMAIVTLSDPDGIYEAVSFGDNWQNIRKTIRKGERVALDVSISRRDGAPRLAVEAARRISDEVLRRAA